MRKLFGIVGRMNRYLDPAGDAAQDAREGRPLK